MDTILAKTASFAGPMIFLMFEAMKCVFDSGVCSDAIYASSYLGSYLLVVMLLGIISKCVSQEVQLAVSMTKEDLALFALDKKKGAQTVLFSVMGVCALMLLPFLESQHDSASTNAIGFAGWLCGWVAGIIQATDVLAAAQRHDESAGGFGRPESGEFRLQENPLSRAGSGGGEEDRERANTEHRFSSTKLSSQFFDVT